MRTGQRTAFLSRITGSVEDQAKWLARCDADPHQIYFVITAKDDEPLGLVRIYDQRGDSFSWGSWLIKKGAPANTAIESALLIYSYAVFQMGFKRSHFDVRVDNTRVIDFHKRFGAVEVGRSAESVYFEIDFPAIANALKRFSKFLPSQASLSRLAHVLATAGSSICRESMT